MHNFYPSIKGKSFQLSLLIFLLFPIGYFSCDECCGDCPDSVCEDNLCLWLTNSSEKEWQVEYVTMYQVIADTCFRDRLSDTQKSERFTFMADGTLKIENTHSEWGPCLVNYSFDTVGLELFMMLEIITIDNECNNIPKDLRIIQLTENLFAYKWPQADYVTHFIPVRE